MASNSVRGINAGGYNAQNPWFSYIVSSIEYITIASAGSAEYFGDLTTLRSNSFNGCATNTRVVFCGGTGDTQHPNATHMDSCEFVTIASSGNGQNFGDLSVARAQCGSTSNSVRGIWWNGEPSHKNEIDFVTIASQGNATDFGNSTISRDAVLGGIQSPTRAIASGGNNSGTRQDVVEYVTIMSTGNAVDFGNLTESRNVPCCSNSVRGIAAGGDPNNSAGTNLVDFITIATTGNSTDFGDLTQARRNQAAVASSTRAVCYGGKTGSTALNTIDFCTIMTLGNYVDFGDSAATNVGRCGLSNGHGGL